MTLTEKRLTSAQPMERKGSETVWTANGPSPIHMPQADTLVDVPFFITSLSFITYATTVCISTDVSYDVQVLGIKRKHFPLPPINSSDLAESSSF